MTQVVPVKLTRKQKAFADGLMENPKASATDIAEQVYQVINRNTARSIATENLSKPALQIYMEEHLGMAKQSIVQLSQQARSEDVRLRASQDILDREHGKARQQIDVTSKSVEIKIAWPTPPSPLSE